MFDPYHKWLGIAKDQRPPTHYQLLAVPQGESDPEVIEEAAIRQSVHVRAYQVGEHAAPATKILNEIALAKDTLTNPAKRRAYDATLLHRQARASTSKLVVVAGPDKGRVFPVADGSALAIGRGAASHVKLVDLAISRLHSEVMLKDGKAFVTDAKSASGTFVNGQRVTSRELKHGDVIKIGDTELRFDCEVGERKTILPAASKRGTAVDVAPHPQPLSRKAPEEPAQEIVFANKPGARKLPTPLKDLHDLAGGALGSFQLRCVIGTGQIGVVFEAKDAKDGKTVALKVLRTDFARDAKAAQRFIRGVKAERTLLHPNLIELYNAGFADPHCWISMELIEGQSLFQILQQTGITGQRDWLEALRWAIHVGRALQVVHEHGLVHRNVTPPNILVRTADRTAKLGDALLAKALDTTAADDISSSGEYVGNIYYMAPERTQQAAKVDGRADLYSLGATLYHVLTGRLPFEGTSMAEVIAKIREAAPEKIRKFNAKVPEPFEKVITRLLAKKPEERYLSARVLVRELEAIAKANRIDV